MLPEGTSIKTYLCFVTHDTFTEEPIVSDDDVFFGKNSLDYEHVRLDQWFSAGVPWNLRCR